MDNNNHIGNYTVRPFTKQRKNISLITREGWRKNCVHAFLEIDVTDAKDIIKKNKKKHGENISFTGWIVKCVAQTVVKHKEFNCLRHGMNKLLIFDDVDIAVPIERKINDENRTMACLIRKANEKTLNQITNEIRAGQKQKINENSQILGHKLSRLERFALNAPMFLQKVLLIIVRKNAILKKKHMGTIGVTAIGMKGHFPGGVIPLGGTTAALFVVGGIVKKPGIVNDKIIPREYLNLTIAVDHDLIDGGPLTRFVEDLTDYMQNSYALK